MRGGTAFGVIAAACAVVAACSSKSSEPEPTAPAATRAMSGVLATIDARLPRTRRALHGLMSNAAHDLSVRLPARAGDPLRITHASRPSIWVEVLAADVQDVAGVLEDDATIFAEARPATDIVLAVDGQRVEELRVLRSERAPTSARYHLLLGPDVAGLRAREGRIELLDANGRVALLADPPFAIDAKGTRRDLEVELDGHTATLSIDTKDLRFPIVVDPGWTTVASMKVARTQHGLVGFGTGKALAAGGVGPAGGLSSAEVYDATANTWTLVASMPNTHDLPGTAVLNDGSIVVCGGYTAPSTGTCNRYNPTANTWSSAGNAGLSGINAQLIVLASGNVFTLAANGNTALYNASANTWSGIAGMLSPDRSLARAVKLPTGRVLVAGGRGGGFPSAATNYYDEGAGLSAGPAMKAGHDDFGMVLLSGGSVLAADGAAELFNPTAGTWATTTAGGVSGLVYAAPLANDAAMFHAGSAAIFDNKTKTWHSVPNIVSRSNAPIALLTGARVIVAGGGTPSAALSSAELFVQGSLGEGCTVSGACLSFFCVDGVCCDTACTGTCQACTAAKRGTGTSGTCGAIANGNDPDLECPTSSCAAGVETKPQDCNGAGACRTNGTIACAAGYSCNGATCATTCASDANCATTHYCAGTACVAKKDNGVSCTAVNQCKSGNCVDGVCCDTGCTGTCNACSAAKKGSGTDGTCAAIAADTDPDNECTMDVAYPNSCGADGACNGMSACRAYAKTGTVCGVTTCAEGKVNGRICNGTGTCDTASTACSPYACGATSCKTTCTADSDCAADAFCTTTGACTPKRSNGETCAVSRECSSGTCADGFCCNAACTGQCESCGEPGNEGKCVPVTGKPRGKRPACTSEGEACGGTCNGVTATECKYPTTECGSSCADGIQKSRVCNGAGACLAGDEKACVAYACDPAGKCRTTCTTDGDCAAAYHCSEAACIPGGKCSDDNSASIAPGGAVTPCGAYRCDPTPGTCRSSCTSSDQCAPAYLCSPTTKSCEPAPAAADDAGCGCRVATPASPASWAWLVGLAIYAATRRSKTRRH